MKSTSHQFYRNENHQTVSTQGHKMNCVLWFDTDVRDIDVEHALCMMLWSDANVSVQLCKNIIQQILEACDEYVHACWLCCKADKGWKKHKDFVLLSMQLVLVWLTWCRQLGREVKLCTWVSPNRQLRKQWRAAWYSPCCWSCCPSSNRPSLPPFSIPSPSQSQHCLPSELHRPNTSVPLYSTPLKHHKMKETATHTAKDLKNTAAHINTDNRERCQRSEQHFLSVSSLHSKSRTGGKEQAEGAPATHTEKIHSPPASQAAPGKEDRGSRRVFDAWVAELWANPCSAHVQ